VLGRVLPDEFKSALDAFRGGVPLAGGDEAAE
jgi:hypothetical protein